MTIDDHVEGYGLSVAATLRGFRDRWKLFAIIVCAFWVLGIIYLLVTPPTYSADVDFSYSDPNNANNEAPSGLSALAGVVGLGGARAGSRDVAIATLKSRQLAVEFVKKYDLLPLLFPDRWNADKRGWSVSPDKIPTPRDGADRLRSVLGVNDNTDTNIIRLTLTLMDQDRVAPLANAYVKLGDDVLRRNVLSDSQESLAYLEQELLKTNITEMRLSITNLIEQNLQRVTVTKTQRDFAFNVIDTAVRPEARSWPRGGMLMVALTVLALLGAAFISIALDLRRSGHLP